MGHDASGGIGRAALAEDLLGMPLRDVCSERALALDRQIQYRATMVRARGFRPRRTQVSEVCRVPRRRNYKSGYGRRLTAGNPNL